MIFLLAVSYFAGWFNSDFSTPYNCAEHFFLKWRGDFLVLRRVSWGSAHNFTFTVGYFAGWCNSDLSALCREVLRHDVDCNVSRVYHVDCWVSHKKKLRSLFLPCVELPFFALFFSSRLCTFLIIFRLVLLFPRIFFDRLKFCWTKSADWLKIL